MNYTSGKAAAQATRFRTGSRRRARFGKMRPPNKPTRTARRALPRSLDTIMGLTPAGSLVMSMRSVDPDPGLMVYLFHGKGIIGRRLGRT